MKKKSSIKFIALVLFIIPLYLSCSSDNNDTDQDIITYVRFSIGNTDYDFKDVITAESTVITLNSNNGDDILDPGDTQLTLWLPLEYEVGTYTISNSTSSEYRVSFTSDDLNFDFDFANSGTIVITESGEFIEGTFTASIRNSNNEEVVISNGEFRASSI